VRPYLEKTHHKKGLVVGLKVVGPEFKPQHQKNPPELVEWFKWLQGLLSKHEALSSSTNTVK
jgi:hypothetical protein